MFKSDVTEAVCCCIKSYGIKLSHISQEREPKKALLLLAPIHSGKLSLPLQLSVVCALLGDQHRQQKLRRLEELFAAPVAFLYRCLEQ